MNKFNVFFKYFGCFFGLLFLFNIMLFLVSLIPSKMIYDNCLRTAEILLEQGNFYDSGFLTLVENNTDCVIINEAYSIDSTAPFESYMLMRKNYVPGVTKVVCKDQYGQLISYAQNNKTESGDYLSDDNYYSRLELYKTIKNEIEVSQTYSRYYHGYMVLLRPMLLFTDINGIRIYTVVLFSALLIIFEILSFKKLGIKNTILLISFLITFGYFGVAQSIELSPLFLIIMLSTIIYLIKADKYNDEKFMFHLFVTAMFSCYVDFLTSPILSLCIPFMVFLMYNKYNKNEQKSFKEIAFRILKFGLIWTVGYFFTMISKWILVELFFDNDGLKSGIEQTLFRINGKISIFDIRIEFAKKFIIDVLKMTYSVSFVCLFIASFFCKKIRISVNSFKNIKNEIDVILVGLIPVAWLLICFNHTIYHFDLYPYRSLLITAMVIPYLIFGNDKKNNERI